jgi:predicted PurR-regulated permease PerM
MGDDKKLPSDLPSNTTQNASNKNANNDGKLSFISMPPQETGNTPYDLLNLLVYLEYVKVYLILILVLLFFINIFNFNKLTDYLEKYLPSKVHKFVRWYITTLKISINTYIFIFLVLLFIGSLISLYGLSFFFDNLEKICEIYLKNIKK